MYLYNRNSKQLKALTQMPLADHVLTDTQFSPSGNFLIFDDKSGDGKKSTLFVRDLRTGDMRTFSGFSIY